MSGWLIAVAGAFVAGIAVMVSVAITTLGRMELTRVVSRRLRGLSAASKFLASQPRVLDAADALASIGALIVGFGMSVALVGLQPLVIAIVIFFLAVPVTLGVAYALPRAIALRWPEPIARQGVGRIARISELVVAGLPARSLGRQGGLVGALKNGDAEQLFEKNELSVITGVLSFNERPVRDLMTPRADVVSVSEGTPLDEIGRVFSRSGFSRVPVHSGSPDNIVGMIHAFDLIKVSPGGELPLRPVAVAPSSKPCGDLLVEMQDERRHLAVVLDEFGGTAGIATLNDLLEGLVTELFREVAAPERDPSTEPVEFDASTPSEQISAHFGVRLPKTPETIGGLLVGAAGRIPRTGERFEISGLEIDVVDSSLARVKRIVVRATPVRTELLRIDGGRGDE